MDRTTEQSLWYEVIMIKLRDGDRASEACDQANVVVDEYRKKFQTQPPAQQE